MTKYNTFGLVWHSPDLDLSPLNKDFSDRTVDVFIKESEEIKYINLKNKDNTPFICIGENQLLIDLENIGKFKISNGNEILWNRSNKFITDDDIRPFIMGSCFGAVLIQRGLLVLHGNALEKNNKAIICLGHSGDGKSTLAYALVKNGWKLISDDLVALDENHNVLPGVPQIKLWQDVLEGFNVKFKKLPRVRNKLNKFYIACESSKQKKSLTKLNSIFILSNNENSFEKEKFSLQELNTEKEKLILLRNRTYRPRFVRGLGKEGPNFAKLNKLIKSFDIKNLLVPRDLTKLVYKLNNIDLIDKV